MKRVFKKITRNKKFNPKISSMYTILNKYENGIKVFNFHKDFDYLRSFFFSYTPTRFSYSFEQVFELKANFLN